jgi:CheY-like chemotaxis protein
VINARDAMPEGGVIRVGTRRQRIAKDASLPDGDYVELTVSDNGAGIDQAILDKVFEPFFTTKPMGQGTGLGLSMIYGFARQSGGEARIRSTLGRGTDVSLLLPAGEGEAESAAPAQEPVTGGRGERILLVEDMDGLRNLTEEVLTQAGYACIATADTQHALRLLRGDEPIDLLLTDIGMPGMDGRELAEAARAWRPALPVLFMTGYAENTMERSRFLGRAMDMIAKPFEIDTLLRRVRAMLD